MLMTEDEEKEASVLGKQDITIWLLHFEKFKRKRNSASTLASVP